jgi:hypothetical protein
MLDMVYLGIDLRSGFVGYMIRSFWLPSVVGLVGDFMHCSSCRMGRKMLRVVLVPLVTW